MTEQPLLDVLLLSIIALFVPIGFARGVLREVFVTAALFAGSALAASWARPWGADLANQLGIRLDIAEFSVAALLLAGTLFALGYGAAAAASPPRPRLGGRLAGAILAGINGALIVAFVLRDIERFLADAGTLKTLSESRVASVLLRDFGWVLVGAAVLAFATVVIASIANGRSDSERQTVPAWQPEPMPDKRKHRLRWGHDGDKVEPAVRGFDPASGRYAGDAPHHADTIPIAAVDPAVWSSDRAHHPSSSPGEWVEVVSSSPESTTTNEPRRCPGCGERTTSMDAFCPRCGRSLGK